MTNSEIKCEHKYRVLIELGFLGQWCSVCGAFKGEDDTEWQLPTRTPEPTKAGNGLVKIDTKLIYNILGGIDPCYDVESEVTDWDRHDKLAAKAIVETINKLSITKEQLLAILPEKSEICYCIDEHYKESLCRDCEANAVIDKMKQRIEELGK